MFQVSIESEFGYFTEIISRILWENFQLNFKLAELA